MSSETIHLPGWEFLHYHPDVGFDNKPDISKNLKTNSNIFIDQGTIAKAHDFRTRYVKELNTLNQLAGIAAEKKSPPLDEAKERLIVVGFDPFTLSDGDGAKIWSYQDLTEAGAIYWHENFCAFIFDFGRFLRIDPKTIEKLIESNLEGDQPKPDDGPGLLAP